jgi:hypothetical protein
VAAPSYLFAKWREREAEWRKLKLDHYREFVAALSGVVGERSNAPAQGRFSEAVNAMVLVAPSVVLRALYAFHDEVRAGNTARSPTGHDKALKLSYKKSVATFTRRTRTTRTSRFDCWTPRGRRSISTRKSFFVNPA